MSVLRSRIPVCLTDYAQPVFLQSRGRIGFLVRKTDRLITSEDGALNSIDSIRLLGAPMSKSAPTGDRSDEQVGRGFEPIAVNRYARGSSSD